MTRDQHKSLVNRLEAMAKRPGMYIGNHDPDRALIWLNGFICAVIAQTQTAAAHYQIRQEAVASRGWQWLSTGAIRQMVERGMSPEEIIAELVAIEIEVLNRTMLLQENA